MIAALLILYALSTFILAAGYVTNVLWLFSHFAGPFTVETLVALVGLFSPLGPLHGVYLWL